MKSALHRCITTILSDDISVLQQFYVELFEFDILYESDWFILLMNADTHTEIGIMKRDHALIPDAFQKSPQGMYLTFVIDDVDQFYATVKNRGIDIIEAPQDTFYGQRRMLLNDPEGTLIDVSSVIS